MFSYFQAIIFGLLQGATELFPISSLGHSVILPRLLGWNINQNDPFFLTFLVATHTATATVLFIFFWKDWLRIIKGIFISIKTREIKSVDSKLGWLLIIGTIPAGLLGFVLDQPLKNLFASPQLVAVILIANGLLLFFAEILRRKKMAEATEKNSDERITKLTLLKSLKIGALQAIALIPGFSRTGASITGGLLVGLNHEDSARFAFLLATPIIAAASFLKLPDLVTTNEGRFLPQIIVGSIASGLAAFLSVKFLTKYFEKNKLTPFAIYCISLGIILSIVFLFR